MVPESAIDTSINENLNNGESPSIFKVRHLWYITTAIILCSALYYQDIILDLLGQPTPNWSVFLITHDLHLFFFSVPLLYAAYVYRVRGIITTSIIVLLIFVPRVVLDTSYLEPFYRAWLYHTR